MKLEQVLEEAVEVEVERRRVVQVNCFELVVEVVEAVPLDRLLLFWVAVVVEEHDDLKMHPGVMLRHCAYC